MFLHIRHGAGVHQGQCAFGPLLLRNGNGLLQRGIAVWILLSQNNSDFIVHDTVSICINNINMLCNVMQFVFQYFHRRTRNDDGGHPV